MRFRHASTGKIAQIDAINLDRASLRIVEPAEQLRDRRLARAVLTDDRERRSSGDGEIETFEDGCAVWIGERHIAKANVSRAGCFACGAMSRCAVVCGVVASKRGVARAEGLRSASAPAVAIAGSRRSTAATGEDAPSSAQLRPPKAIIETPTALKAKTTAWASVKAPRSVALASAPEHDDVRGADDEQAPRHRLFAQARGFVLQRVETRAAGDETIERPVREAEQPHLLGGRGIDGHPIGIFGVTLRGAHFLGVAIHPDGAFAQEPVRREPRAAEDERRPPRIREQHDGAGEAADGQDETVGDEVHRDVERGTGHAGVELAGDGQVGGELRIFEVTDAGRPHARLGEPIVEPRGGAIAEIRADRRDESAGAPAAG